MELTRASLCALLLEEGAEDLAVLVARADLPEVLDSERDAPRLAALGLDADELEALLPAVHSGACVAAASFVEDVDLCRTISERWADLVTGWTRALDT